MAVRCAHGRESMELLNNKASGSTPSPIERVNGRYGTWRGWVRMVLSAADWRFGRLNRWARPELGKARRLVFVCLGNINRSAFACAVAQRAGEPCISIGLSTTTGAPATPQAIAQACAQGFDLSVHEATNFVDYAYAEGDLLLVMEVRHAFRLVELGIPSRSIALLGAWATPRRIHLHDPHTLSAEYFATCFRLIESAVTRLLEDWRAIRP
jgi:protein-tyrosine phosphatase